MKKQLLVLLTMLLSVNIFAQDFSGSKSGDPEVSMNVVEVTGTTISVAFDANAECSYYYCLLLPEDEIAMWMFMMGIPLDSLVYEWGASFVQDTTYTWTELVPSVNYRVLVRPYDEAGVGYPSAYINVTTNELGGEGNAAISISVLNVTENSARVLCTPNDQTASFYDGLVTVDYYNEVGMDTVKAILMEDPNNLHFETDDWEWMGLLSNTDYYAIAFGQNALGEWGADALVPFTTLEEVGDGVDGYESPVIVVYPMPCHGNFNIAGKDIANSTVQIYSISGQLLKQFNVDSDNTYINAELPAGSYAIRVIDTVGKVLGKKTIVVY